MLKKLAKYGNSTTLVIDKAILELLNMDESSLVKLHTDGKSLIITPVAATKDKVSYGPEEAFRAAVQTSNQKSLENVKVDAATVEKLMPIMEKEFKDVFAKHKASMDTFNENFASNKEFQESMADLAQKWDPVTQSQDYLKELHKLRVQFFPELAQIDKEIAAITQKYNNI